MSFLAASADGGISLRLFVQPKARKTAILGIYDDMLKLGVAAPPVDGKANGEVQRFLARFFGVRKSAVTIASGLKSRRKLCLVESVSREVAEEKIDKVLQKISD